MSRSTATVKWFNNDKGYGFLTDHDGEDVIVHHTNIRMDGYRTLVEGQEVEYTCEETDNGLSAVEVVPLTHVERTIALPADPELAAATLRREFPSRDLATIVGSLVSS